MTCPDPDLVRTWLFGPGADLRAHAAMLASAADALILDLEDFTPPARRKDARKLIAGFSDRCREAGKLAVVRINQLSGDGEADLAAAMAAAVHAVALPMAETAAQIADLNHAIAAWEIRLGFDAGRTWVVPVCETARGVADVRILAAASERVRCAILGSEDLAADLCAERGPDGIELEHARRRFVLDCRACDIEPIDAPYTYADVEGALREASFVRRLGYRSKALVRPDHADALNGVFTPSAVDLERARRIVDAFEAARERGEDRVLVDGQWVKVPTWRNACRLIERAQQLLSVSARKT